MFDLPVLTSEERKAAAGFRLSLLDQGFSMSQFSIYLRYCSSSTQVETYIRRVEAALPVGGKVNILQFTDRQYENIVSFKGRNRQAANKIPEQFLLF